MKKKLIGIIICMTLVITSLSVSAFIVESEIIQISKLTDGNLIDGTVERLQIIDQCIAPDNGGGTADLPAACPYEAPEEPFFILDGLPLGTTMELDPIFNDFESIVRTPGGLLGGEILDFDATLELDVTGTGSLTGFNRHLSVPVLLVVHTGPRTPGDPVQTFASEIFQLHGEIYGDPDFCTIRITAGSDYGLPSPGQFILTELPSGNYNIDSFFDITYQIEFEGCPGSIIEGYMGTTTGTTRLQQGTEVTNTPPNTPSKPSGPTSGIVGVSYFYTTSAIDPDGDDIRYGWDWDGDGIVDEYSNLMNSGNVDSRSHSWSSTGTYNVKVKAKDEHNALSGFSSPLAVTITSGVNQPPNKPSTPSGPTSGKTGTQYGYSSNTIDSDGDDVFYMFDWGDGTNSGWLGPYISGDTVNAFKTWTAQGSYSVKVKAMDSNLEEGPWSDPLAISMPKNKAINPFLPFLERLIERFPILEQILQPIYDKLA